MRLEPAMIFCQNDGQFRESAGGAAAGGNPLFCMASCQRGLTRIFSRGSATG